jgi:hypothetical protein
MKRTKHETFGIVAIVLGVSMWLITLLCHVFTELGYKDGFNECERSLREAGALDSDYAYIDNGGLEGVANWKDLQYLRVEMDGYYIWYNNKPLKITESEEWMPKN